MIISYLYILLYKNTPVHCNFEVVSQGCTMLYAEVMNMQKLFRRTSSEIHHSGDSWKIYDRKNKNFSGFNRNKFDIEDFMNAGHYHRTMTHERLLYIAVDRIRTAMPFVVFLLLYMIFFVLLENWNRLHYTVIHMHIDDLIPFCEVFVVPYLLWFPYVALSVILLLFTDNRSYHRLCTFLAIGMGAFLVISALFPNIQLLRPDIMPRDNIFTRLIAGLYLTDTPTNVTPSIHVFNSISIMLVASTSSSAVFRKLPVKVFWNVLGFLIVLSTMFIKQHSFSDVLFAFGLCSICYILVYRLGFTFISEKDSLAARHRAQFF